MNESHQDGMILQLVAKLGIADRNGKGHEICTP